MIPATMLAKKISHTAMGTEPSMQDQTVEATSDKSMEVSSVG